MAIDLLNSLLENTGGDSKDVISKRVSDLKNISPESFNLTNKKWTMNYENE